MSKASPSRATRADMTINRALPGSDRAVSWSEFRDDVGRRRDRWRALQLISAATGYKPLPHQLRFHLADARHRLLVSGVGAGKTLASVIEMAIVLVMNPGCSAAFVSPTFDSVQNIILPEWLRVVDKMAAMGCPLQAKYSKSQAKADLVGGGFLALRSFDRVDNLRGFTLCAVNVDESEVSSRPDYVFQTLNDRVRDPRANVLEINVTTTPKGLRGVPRMFAERRKTEDRGDWWAGRATSMDNPHLPTEFLKSLRAGHSKRSYQQEVEGKILQPSNVVFPEVSRERHSIPWAFDPMLPYVLACDFGYSNPYYGFAQILPDGTAVIFDEWHPDECPEEIQKDTIQKKIRALGKDPQHISGDRAVPRMLSWFTTKYPRAYIHRMRTREQQSILGGIEVMRAIFDPLDGPPRLLIADKLWRTNEPRGIARSLQNYRWKMTREGLISDEPYKDNLSDHAVDSWRYMCQSVFATDDRGAFTLGRSNHADPFSKTGRFGHR